MPRKINNVLFGDRSKYGTKIVPNDTDWKNWLLFYEKFYFNTQKKGIGRYINNAGYKILKKVDFKNKNLLELGPGALPHKSFWKNKPRKYYAIDVNKKFLNITKKLVDCEFQAYVSKNNKLPRIKNESIDIILTFYSLEHVYKLEDTLVFFHNILKKNGLLIGAIPNEGGIAWGFGRQLTSKKFVKKNNKLNYDKIICWEHPNFCDQIMKKIKSTGFKKHKENHFPFNFIPNYDINLVTTFIYKK